MTLTNQTDPREEKSDTTRRCDADSNRPVVFSAQVKRKFSPRLAGICSVVLVALAIGGWFCFKIIFKGMPAPASAATSVISAKAIHANSAKKKMTSPAAAKTNSPAYVAKTKVAAEAVTAAKNVNAGSNLNAAPTKQPSANLFHSVKPVAKKAMATVSGFLATVSTASRNLPGAATKPASPETPATAAEPVKSSRIPSGVSESAVKQQFRLSCVIVSDEGATAVINGAPVRVGQVLRMDGVSKSDYVIEAVIKKIHRNFVEIDIQGEIFIVRI